MAQISLEKVAELESFITLLRDDASLINRPELAFFKEYLVSLGAKIPDCPEPASSTSATKDEHDSEQEADEVPFDESTLNDEQVVAPETDDLPELAPSGERELTEEEIQQLSKLKEDAATAVSDHKFDVALDYYTKALRIGNPTALLYTRRAEVLAKLNRFMASIRDCDEAVKLNPDNAKAYQIRGKSYRFLGKWREAHRDLDVGQKLDYNDDLWEMQKLVDEKFKKIETYEREVGRKREEREKARRVKQAKEQRDATQRVYEEKKKRESENMGEISACVLCTFAESVDQRFLGVCFRLGGFSGGMPGGAPGSMPGNFPGNMPGYPGAMPGGFPGGMSGGFPGGFPGGMGGGMPGGVGGMPGGGSGLGGLEGLLGGLNDPEMKEIFTNPKMMAAFQDIMKNPAAMSKYQSDPEVMAMLNKLTSKFGGSGGVGSLEGLAP